MENLNAENVKYGLECIGREEDVLCADCVYRKYDGLECHRIVAREALALITSQEQRIKELTEENERLRGEIEQQREINQVLRYLYVPYAECFDNVDPNKDCDAEDLISRYGDLIKNKGETANEN